MPSSPDDRPAAEIAPDAVAKAMPVPGPGLSVFSSAQPYEIRILDSWLRVDMDVPPEVLDHLRDVGLDCRACATDPAPGEVVASLASLPSRDAHVFMAHGVDKRPQVMPLTTLVALLCIQLARASGRLHPDRLHLHAACFETGGLTVLVLATYVAGKSSLCAAMARRGARVLADDAVIVDIAAGEVLEHGLPYRIRNGFLPVCAPETRAFIAQAGVLADDQVTFFRSAGQNGRRRRIDLVLHTSRDETQEPVLEQIGIGPALKRLLSRDLRTAIAPDALLPGLFALFGDVPHLHYRYRETEQAADLLTEVLTDAAPWHLMDPGTDGMAVGSVSGTRVLETDEWCFVGAPTATQIAVMKPQTYRLWQEMDGATQDLEALARHILEDQPAFAAGILADRLAQVRWALRQKGIETEAPDPGEDTQDPARPPSAEGGSL